MGAREQARRYASLYRQKEEARRRGDARRAVEIKARLPEVAQLLRRDYGASEVGYFGSLCGGTLRAESDVDLFADRIRPGAYFEALDRITEILGLQVDLVELASAPPSLSERIRVDGIRIDG
jgi:predicted nucleotidyltransferase